MVDWASTYVPAGALRLDDDDDDDDELVLASGRNMFSSFSWQLDFFFYHFVITSQISPRGYTLN